MWAWQRGRGSSGWGLLLGEDVAMGWVWRWQREREGDASDGRSWTERCCARMTRTDRAALRILQQLKTGLGTRTEITRAHHRPAENNRSECARATGGIPSSARRLRVRPPAPQPHPLSSHVQARSLPTPGKGARLKSHPPLGPPLLLDRPPLLPSGLVVDHLCPEACAAEAERPSEDSTRRAFPSPFVSPHFSLSLPLSGIP